MCADMQIAMTDREDLWYYCYSTRHFSYYFCRCDHYHVIIIIIFINDAFVIIRIASKI